MVTSTLISFASEKFLNQQRNLISSIGGGKFGVDSYISYTEDIIPDSFKEKNPIVWNSPRGFGYWSWKPYIILDALNKVEDGDIVIYIDTSNIVISDLSHLFRDCENEEIILFDNRDGHPSGECWKNSMWTKRDCFTLMDCDSEMYWSGKQINASYQLYKKSSKAISFLYDYLSYSLDERIITDNPNTTLDNLPDFRDHRHDQSICSLLAIKHGIKLRRDPSQFGNVGREHENQLFWHCRGLGI